MTVKEFKEELEFYDDEAEVIFSFEDDVDCESWTEDKYGNKKVSNIVGFAKFILNIIVVGFNSILLESVLECS